MPAAKEIQWEKRGDCMVVTSHRLTRAGYVVFCRGGKQRLFHRLVCERRHGSAPGLHAMHSCDNPACINPEHLSFGTSKQNIQGAVERKRNAFGERNGQSRLTDKLALKIFKASGTHREIAAKFGVEHRTVGRIKCKSRWKHIH